MVGEIDIWRSANLLIKQHGDKAWTEAAVRAIELFQAGDIEGFNTMGAVAQAIASMTFSRADEPTH